MADSKNLWGGRFKGKSDPRFAAFNNSFQFDRRLLEADVTASLAYAHALTNAGVLDADESSAIGTALKQILVAERAESGYLNDSNAEDVHSFVEARLVESIGDI